MRKLWLVLFGLCVLTPAAFAQKGMVKVAKGAVEKPRLSLPRPPLSTAAGVPPVAQTLRQNFMQGWNLALEAQVTRKALQAVSAQETLPLVPDLPNYQSYVAQKLQPIYDYLATHQNNWPHYSPRKEDAQLLHYISQAMEVQNPSPQQLALQQEIIRLRATSNALSPYEVLERVSSLMEYGGIVPSRATQRAQESGKSEEEMDVGEELAFALAAIAVPMPQNPWTQISDFKRIADIVSTYRAMRRENAFSEGIVQMYIGPMGIHYPNITLLTKQQYLEQQRLFIANYPFEYVLAPFWEKTLGQSFFRIFNTLSDLEKQAILFSAPQLPKTAVCEAYFDNELKVWIQRQGREPNHYTGVGRVKELTAFLTSPEKPTRAFYFWIQGQSFCFRDLSYPQQLEVLLWVWKNLRISPARALERFEIDSRDFF